jgi:hypothetical protein
MTFIDERRASIAPGSRATEPRSPTELVEVLDTMRVVLGPPEAMESPRARAIYLLNQTRLAAAYRHRGTTRS